MTRRRWRDAFIVGALLIVGGTALVGWAELSVPSGITSLILATTPLWMVLLEGVESPHAPAPRVIVGVCVGLGGLAILIGPSLIVARTGVELVRCRRARARRAHVVGRRAVLAPRGRFRARPRGRRACR